MIKQYAIAKCSLGVLGIITSSKMEEVTYSDGNKGVAWTGFVVEPTQIEGIKGDAGKIIDVKVGNLWCHDGECILASSIYVSINTSNILSIDSDINRSTCCIDRINVCIHWISISILILDGSASL